LLTSLLAPGAHCQPLQHDCHNVFTACGDARVRAASSTATSYQMLDEDGLLCLQRFKSDVVFKLGLRDTGFLLLLRVANVTYVPPSPRIAELRDVELLLQTAQTPQCFEGDSAECYESIAILDTYAQLPPAACTLHRICLPLYVLALHCTATAT
jgi:hypothetical protein